MTLTNLRLEFQNNENDSDQDLDGKGWLGCSTFIFLLTSLISLVLSF